MLRIDRWRLDIFDHGSIADVVVNKENCFLNWRNLSFRVSFLRRNVRLTPDLWSAAARCRFGRHQLAGAIFEHPEPAWHSCSDGSKLLFCRSNHLKAAA